jgi:hypothetical protein
MTHPAANETYPPGDTPFGERMDMDEESITWVTPGEEPQATTSN